ncbi:MAG: hypothetical protein H0T88_02220 [Lysobacter sp.]|nr:hypothetical protein [Lysobacter sp.]
MSKKRLIAAAGMMIVAGWICVSGVSATKRDLAAAEVFVYTERVVGGFRYTYVIKNNSSAPITGLEIGFDYYSGTPQLSGSDPARVGSPSKWTGSIVNMDESKFFNVAWEPLSAESAVKPSKMQSGFVLESPTHLPQFTTSKWTVTFDGGIIAASARLEQIQAPAPDADTLPPEIQVTATPSTLWPPNSRLHPIVVDVSVSDDDDPNPTVKLESISCNSCAEGDISGADIGSDDRTFLLRARRGGRAKGGRIYTITYEARDASGNVSTSTATVQVPHDSR